MMRTIGIIGGMSAESTALYYNRMNKTVRRTLGDLHSAETIIWSVDFATIAALQAAGDWAAAGQRLADIAMRLERAGAEVLVLATNTMHKVLPAIEEAVTIPVIHIADATAEQIKRQGLRRPGLLATRYTMEQDFYTGRLRDQHGLEAIVPDAADRTETHRVIYDELCKGTITPASRGQFEAIASRLVAAGADCLILGCTEVGMLLNARNVSVPVFDTALIHADAAVAFALAPNVPAQAFNRRTDGRDLSLVVNHG